MLCGGEGGVLFEGGGTVQGRDDRTMQPGAMLNIQKHVHTSRSPFHFLVVFIVRAPLCLFREHCKKFDISYQYICLIDKCRK